MKKLATLLFSVLLVFTTQTVYAQDQATSSASLLETIPVEFIAIPLIIIFLIALGLLAKQYPRYRYNMSEAENLVPAYQKVTENKPSHTQDEKSDKPVKVESKESNRQEHAKIIALPESEGTVTRSSKVQEESPVPKEYKILQILAYILIVSGLIMKFVVRNKKGEK